MALSPDPHTGSFPNHTPLGGTHLTHARICKSQGRFTQPSQLPCTAAPDRPICSLEVRCAELHGREYLIVVSLTAPPEITVEAFSARLCRLFAALEKTERSPVSRENGFSHYICLDFNNAAISPDNRALRALREFLDTFGSRSLLCNLPADWRTSLGNAGISLPDSQSPRGNLSRLLKSWHVQFENFRVSKEATRIYDICLGINAHIVASECWAGFNDSGVQK